MFDGELILAWYDLFDRNVSFVLADTLFAFAKALMGVLQAVIVLKVLLQISFFIVRNHTLLVLGQL